MVIMDSTGSDKAHLHQLQTYPILSHANTCTAHCIDIPQGNLTKIMDSTGSDKAHLLQLQTRPTCSSLPNLSTVHCINIYRRAT
jgi:hypothetical protein